jgi:hypothetical protein
MLAGGLRYNLDSQKAKVGIKVGSRKRRARIEASIKTSEEKQQRGIDQELSKWRLAELKKSLSATAHL